MNTSLLSSPEMIEIKLKERLSQLYRMSGIPLKYHFCTLEKSWSTDFTPSQKLDGAAKKRSKMIKKIIESYIEHIDGILNAQGLKLKFKDRVLLVTDMFLIGGKESGKTLLLSLIGQSAINKGYKVKFVNWADYVDRFLSFESRAENEDFYEDCLIADLLIFDSVHDYNTNGNKFFMLQLDRLIATRLDKGKVTMCSFDDIEDLKPVFEHAWNRFTRETFALHLPGTIK